MKLNNKLKREIMHKTKKQRNSHARSKKNKKKMMAKERHMRLMESHLSMKSSSSPGKIAQLIKKLNVVPKKEITRSERFRIRGTLNQRQKRKLWRQAPWMKKAA